MNHLRTIRSRLGVSQGHIAEVLGCSQGNVSGYERGQYAIPPESAAKLIDFARSRGLEITYDNVYGAAPLPDADPVAAAASPTAAIATQTGA
jgi:putative transcriptional regulator